MNGAPSGFHRLAGLSDDRVLSEGKKARPGEVRRWGDGHDYEKQTDGSWKKVAAKTGAPKPSVADPLAGAVAASAAAAKAIRAKPADDPFPSADWTQFSTDSGGHHEKTQIGDFRARVSQKWKETDWSAEVTDSKWKTVAKQGGFKSMADAQMFAKQAVATAQAAQAAASPPPPKSSGTTASDVKSALANRKTKTGGRLELDKEGSDENFLSFEPQYRQRLDHYGTSYDSDDEEQEGWDEEGWEQDYAGPLRDEVEALLKDAGFDLNQWVVDVGEKGHVEVQRVKRSEGNMTGDIDVLLDEARSLLENGTLKYADDPVGYNTALAKLMQGLKKAKGAGVSAVRQGYKGTGSKAYKRQIWCQMPDHDRGGPDVWLDNGFVKFGGIVAIPNNIPHARKYGEDPPEVVYNWIVDTFKQVQAWIDAKYAQPPQSPQSESDMNEAKIKKQGLRAGECSNCGVNLRPTSGYNVDGNLLCVLCAEKRVGKDALRVSDTASFKKGIPGTYANTKESSMNAETTKKLEALRHELETELGLGEEGALPKYPAPAKNAMGAQDLKHAAVKSGSTPQYKSGNVPAKNAMGSQDVKTHGAQSTPPSKKVKDSIAPSKMESLPGFRRLAGLEDLRRIVTSEE